MYSINLQKFQNTPRGTDGRASVGAKRTRLPNNVFEDDSIFGRSRVLHPTKGWRLRNLEVLRKHGEMTLYLHDKKPIEIPKKPRKIIVDDEVFGRREISIHRNKYTR